MNKWIEYGKPWYAPRGIECFWRSGFNKPGTIVETEGGLRLLIGDINTNAGRCDCCAEFSSNPIIKQYLILDLEEFNLNKETKA